MKNKVFFTASIFLFSVIGLNAEIKSDSQSAYIKNLYENEKYFQTIAETDRYIITNSLDKNKYNYFFALNFFHGGQFHSAVKELSLSEAHFNESNLLYLYSLYNLDEPEIIGQETSTLDISEIKTVYLNDLCFLNAQIYIDKFDFKKAYETLSRFSSTGKNDFNTKYMLLLSEYKNLHYKSAGVSMFLSAMFPGAGQFYSKRYFDSFISIIAIAGSAFLTYELYSNDRKAETVLTGSFTALLYAGNIYSAHNSAEYYNYMQSESFRKKILKELDYSYDPDEYLNYDELFSK